MSKTHELKVSTVVVDLVNSKGVLFNVLVLKIKFSVKVMVDLHIPPAIIYLCKYWQELYLLYWSNPSLAFQKLISSLAKGANQRDKMFCFVMILRSFLDVEKLKF